LELEKWETLFDLLLNRKIQCVGIDSDNTKCKNYSENQLIKNPEYLHVCLPEELEKFTEIILDWINKINGIQVVIIHSTVKPGTTKNIQEKLSISVLFSPIHGVHRRFFDGIKKYTKFISFDKQEIDSKIKIDLEKRFEKRNGCQQQKLQN